MFTNGKHYRVEITTEAFKSIQTYKNCHKGYFAKIYFIIMAKNLKQVLV